MTDRHLKPDEQKIVSVTRTILDASVEQIRPEVQKELMAIRKKAVLAAADRKHKKITISDWFVPVATLGSATAALLLIINVWFISPNVSELPVSPLEDIQLLSGTEEIELYQDLDFYQWLAANEQAVS